MKRWLKLTLFMLIFLAWNAGAEPILNFAVAGLSDQAKTNAVNALKHLQGTLEYPLTEETILEFYHEAPKTIQTAIEPYGFFHSVVIPQIAQVGNVWTATFTVETGPPVYVTTVDVTVAGEGATDPAFIKFQKKLPIKSSQILNIESYNSAKDGLQSLATQRGYFRAQLIESKLIINLQNNEAQVILHFETGPRFRFGHTTFSHSSFALNFLSGFLYYFMGQPYDLDRIQKTQQSFAKSNYFAEAVITPMPEQAGPDLLVPIHIQLIPRKAMQYIFGLGYGTDTGPRGTLGVSFRRLNAYGHRLNFLLQAARVNNSLVATYEIPGPRPSRDTFLITGGGGNLRVATGNSRTAKLAAGYATEFGDVKQTIFLTYLNEKYSLTNFPIPNLNAQMLYPSIRWQFFKADSILEPNYGIRAYLRLSGTSKKLSNSDGFTQERGYVRALWTLQKTNTRFLGRAEFGHTDIENLANLPLSLQLLAGGANSIRGFSYYSIGPGRNLYVGSMEIQQKIYGRWYLAAFYDVGNVTNASPFQNLEQTLKGVRQSVGPGIVWLTPLGALELDVAWAISEHNTPWRLQFSMGPVL